MSACLAGRACTHRGGDNAVEDLLPLAAEAVLVCPEVEGGLGTPRPAAEIVGGDGHDVLDGRARVLTVDGEDVTDQFVRGAEVAVAAARAAGVAQAILKSRSPSCGCGGTYDGTFTHTLVTGDGVAAAALRRAGIEVRTEEDHHDGS
ncbi:MAG: DUF523 domain-containing protein [Nitriliruptorales bacterium]|nr:DUF523 domain-containing protein [Nitriliruptorales bacterium]